jgi:hypothetical protein
MGVAQDPVVGARLVRRLLDGLQAKKPVAACGAFKVEPRGWSSWVWYVELLVAGPEAFYLASGMRRKKGRMSAPF